MGRCGADVVSPPLALSWTLGGSDESIALAFPDGRTQTYGALRAAAVDRRRDLRPHRAVACRSDPRDLLVDALAAWDAGAVAVPGSVTVDATRELDARAALLLFTSGSTGAPKGVLLGGAGLRANVEAILSYLPVTAVPDTALLLPLHYSYALVGQALTTLHAGGTVHLLHGLTYPAEQLAAIARVGRPVGLSTVPTSLRLLASTQLELGTHLKPGYLASAGGRLTPSTIALVRSAFPGVRLFNQYGLTEASPRVTSISDEDPSFAFNSVGRALPSLQVFAVGMNSGERLPTGASGELAVRGPSVMLGYLDDDVATARVLSPDGTLKTGDLGYVDRDGLVFVEGRRDGVVKVAGERVSLAEISEQLGAELVAVVDEALGPKLIAFVEGDASAVRTKARALPPQKRPSRVVALDHFPRTANGKIDLAALKELAGKP